MKVVITGASSGIGAALARHYLERGATVGAFARRTGLLRELSEAYPGRVHPATVDVRDAEGMRRAALDFVTRVGTPDIVIANAGVSWGSLTDRIEDDEVFQQIMDVNVGGMWRTFQPFLAPMRSAKRGALVGVASVAGLRGIPGSGAYSASKAAAIAYLESLRVELRGTGLRVITVCPGYVRTPMTAVNTFPMPFLIEADDAARRIARAVARGKSLAVIPWQMGVVGSALRLLPNAMYDWMFSKAPRKPRRFA